jgi:hypothetical protein
MTGIDFCFKKSLKKDFPAPIPPVSPTKIILQKKKGPPGRSLKKSDY